MRKYRASSYSPNVTSFTDRDSSSLARNKNIKPTIAAVHARSELFPPPGLSNPNRRRLYPSNSVLSGNRRLTFLLDIANPLSKIPHRAPTFVKSFSPLTIWGNRTPLTFPRIVEAFNPRTPRSLNIKFSKSPSQLSPRLPNHAGRLCPLQKFAQCCQLLLYPARVPSLMDFASISILCVVFAYNILASYCSCVVRVLVANSAAPFHWAVWAPRRVFVSSTCSSSCCSSDGLDTGWHPTAVHRLILQLPRRHPSSPLRTPV